MPKDTKKHKSKAPRIDPLDVTESLGYTTHRRGARKPWTKEEDELLRCSVNNCLIKMGYPEGINSISSIQESNTVCRNISWDEIATAFHSDTRKAKDVRKRWTSSLDPNLRKGKWTTEEDEQLIKSYQKYGSQWLKISMEIRGRTEDQCAKRYIEVLDPSTKDRLREWNLKEDLALIEKVKRYGTKWRKISSEMESRPSLTCRNRWRKIITMIMRGKASEVITKAVQESTNGQVHTLEQLRESLQIKVEDMNESHENGDHNPIQQTENEQENAESARRFLPPIETLSNTPTTTTDGNNVHFDHLSSRNQTPVVLNSRSPSLPPLQKQHSQSTEKPGTNTLSTNNDVQELHKHKLHGQEEQHVQPHTLNPEISSKNKSHTTHMDWRYTLKETSGLSISNGSISNSDLVKELIEQAKKYSLKISIHQHIHNHYGVQSQFQQQPLPPQSKHSQPQQATSAPVSGNQFSISSPLGFYNSALEDKVTTPGLDFETDFLSRQSNYSMFGLEPSPQPHYQQLQSQPQQQQSQILHPPPQQVNGVPNTFHHYYHHHHHTPPASSQPPRPGTTSSTGSHSTPGGEIQEIGPSRHSHFNYLPPSVRPQLGSSDSTRAADLSKLLNPSPPVHGNFGKKRKKKKNKNTNSASGGTTPNSNNASAENTPRDIKDSNLRAKTGLTPGTVSSLGDEEGLDFWESLRSLATGPNPITDHQTSHDTNHSGQTPNNFDLFYNIFESRSEQLDVSGTSQHSTKLYKDGNTRSSDEEPYNDLPFNPS